MSARLPTGTRPGPWTDDTWAAGLLMQRPSLGLIEAASRSLNADFVILDLQHGLGSHEDVDAVLALSASLGIHCFVRIPAPNEEVLTTLVDGGAAGIIVPMVEDTAECRRIRQLCAFPPRGARSINTRCRSVQLDLGEPLIIAMVESVAGIDAFERIIDDPAVDAVYFGPADLQVSMTQSRTFVPDEATWSVIREATAVARERSVPVGAHAVPQAFRNEFDFITFGTELQLLEAGWNAAAPNPRTR